jgi:ABC-type molybdate transport system substrate-binding protein
MIRKLAALLLLVTAASPALAGDLTVIGQATALDAFDKLVPRFEKQTGDKVQMSLGNPGVTHDRLQKNPDVDVIIVGSSLLARLAKEGAVSDAATRIAIGTTHIGMAVPVHAQRPVLRDAASFASFLRQVKTIGLVDPNGGSGTSPPFIAAVKALGLDAEIAPKYRFYQGVGANVADAIAKGEVDTGATAITELTPNKGVKVIGRVPADVLTWNATTYAVIGDHARNPREARKFLRFLQLPPARKAFAAIGFSPAN